MSDGSDLFAQLEKELDEENESTMDEVSEILNMDAIIKSLDATEKRQDDRIPIELTVMIYDSIAKQIYKGTTVNMSKHGLCAYVSEGKYKIQEGYRLAIRDSFNGHPYEVYGNLVRLVMDPNSNFQLLAFQFQQLPDEILKRL